MTVFMPDLSFNPDAAVTLRRVGYEGQPVLVIDGAMAEPGNMVEIARRIPFRPPARSLYPGLTATPATAPISASCCGRCGPLLSNAFGIAPEVELTAHGFFASRPCPPRRCIRCRRSRIRTPADPMRLGHGALFLSRTTGRHRLLPPRGHGLRDGRRRPSRGLRPPSRSRN
ncbi:MAG: DUF6445 family protein [Asticcacaulis sp.]